jgi:hypothetical protein
MSGRARNLFGQIGDKAMANRNSGQIEAGHQYAAAYAAQYETKNLREALDLYKGIMTAYPTSHEAEYSRAQIQSIVNAVVPKQELFDAQLELALAHVEDEALPANDPDPVELLASDMPSWQI